MRTFLIVLAALLLAPIARADVLDAPTSGTATERVLQRDATGQMASIYSLRVTATSDANGDAVIATNGSIHGMLVEVVTNAGDGASSPTAKWDLTLLDEDGLDVLGGALADRWSTTTQSVRFITDAAPPIPLASPLTLKLSDMGSTRTAAVSLKIVRR